jgi:hypothetical protein
MAACSFPTYFWLYSLLLLLRLTLLLLLPSLLLLPPLLSQAGEVEGKEPTCAAAVQGEAEKHAGADAGTHG